MPPTCLETDERLWAEFVGDFTRAYLETASAEQVYAELTRLKMRNDKIDKYIATFGHLQTKAI
jgi:hypothetical protein